MEKRAGKGQALLHAAREDAYWSLAPLLKSYFCEDGVNTRLGILQLVCLSVKGQVLFRCEIRVEKTGVTKETEPPPRRGVCRRMAEQPQGPSRWLEQCREKAEKGGFPCSIGTEYAHNFSCANLTRNVLQHGSPGERFPQVFCFNNPACHKTMKPTPNRCAAHAVDSFA